MRGRLSFLSGEVSIAGITTVTMNCKKSVEVIVAKDRTVSVLGKFRFYDKHRKQP